MIEWHRAGFRLYWKCLSRARRLGGRKPLAKEIRALIFRMAAENPTWGAPRIHGELLKLGFKVSEPTVSRWLKRAPRIQDVAERWLTFLRNTAKQLRPWTSSPCRPIPSVSCIASSSSLRAKTSRLQRHTIPERSVDRTADARSMGVFTGSEVPIVRP